MIDSKPFIQDVIEKEFQDPIKASHIRTTASEILRERPGSASRIFDKLPCLLPQTSMQTILTKFSAILSNIKLTKDINGMDIPSTNDENTIGLFIKEIASLAIHELLDENDHIKIELIKLMEWDSFKDQLGRTELTIAILCGYIGAIHQEIAANLSHEILKYDVNYAAITGYLNKMTSKTDHMESNTHRWVMESLRENRHILEPSASHKTNTHCRFMWPNDHPTTGSLMVLAAITKSSSVSFFKKNTAEQAFPSMRKTKPSVSY